jgi:hypothetical protein
MATFFAQLAPQKIHSYAGGAKVQYTSTMTGATLARNAASTN